ncbi:calcium-binding protein, partial [Methylobacterium trifolii]|uniref:calcium-binding protein n=1 Tax=Methylobacterium trifolii TaxID=1003092 RepID=UPI0035A24A60
MGFLGRNVALNIYYPRIGTSISYQSVARVADGTVEFANTSRFDIPNDASQVVNADIDVGDARIDYRIDDTRFSGFAGANLSSLFNGYVLSDVDGTVAPIVGYSIDSSSNTLGLTANSVSFDADSVYVNVSGMNFRNGDAVALDLIFQNGTSIDGTASSDLIRGGAAVDTILGRGGNDSISGGSGADAIFGNQGEDSLFGNQG